MLSEKRNDPDFKEEESLSLSELRKKAAGKLAGKVLVRTERRFSRPA